MNVKKTHKIYTEEKTMVKIRGIDFCIIHHDIKLNTIEW